MVQGKCFEYSVRSALSQACSLSITLPGEVQGCRPVFRGEVLAWNAVGENCKSIRDRVFLAVFRWRYVNAVWNWGRKFKVDVMNHDFTLRKKKKEKNQCLVLWFVCHVHWVTHVGNFLSQVWLWYLCLRCLIHIVALLHCLSGAKACVNIDCVH